MNNKIMFSIEGLESGPKRRLTDEEYKFIFERAVRFCLDFIIVKNRQVLLAKRNIEPYKGYWSLPGGMVRYGESINGAVKRILKEELNLKLPKKELIGYIEFSNEINQNKIHIHSVSMAFLVKLDDGKIHGSDQAYEVRFFKSLAGKIHPVHEKFLKNNWKMIIK